MAKKRHIYRRGNQYWFRVSVTVAHRQRVDVRFPLRTDSLFVSNQLCSILEGELARIAGREQKMFQLFSQRNVAGSSPSVPMSEIKEMVKKHFIGVLDEAHRKRRNMGLWDRARNLAANVLRDEYGLPTILAMHDPPPATSSKNAPHVHIMALARQFDGRRWADVTDLACDAGHAPLAAAWQATAGV
jgi:hypothetical protein